MRKLKTIILRVGDTNIDIDNTMSFPDSCNLNFIVVVSATTTESKLQKIKKEDCLKIDLTDEEFISRKLDPIKNILLTSCLVFIISDFSDKTDYLLAYQIASLANNSSFKPAIGIIPIGSMFYPFKEELSSLRDKIDFIIFLNNCNTRPCKTTRDELSISSNSRGFNNNKLFNCIQGITEILTGKGLVCLQFEDIKLLLSGMLIAKSIEISSFEKIFKDVNKLLSFFDLEHFSLEEVKVTLISMKFNHDVIDFESDQIDFLNNLGKTLFKKTQFMWTTTHDSSADNKIKIMIYMSHNMSFIGKP